MAEQTPLGVAGLVAPARVGRVFGMGEYRMMSRGLAVRDLVIGLGLGLVAKGWLARSRGGCASS